MYSVPLFHLSVLYLSVLLQAHSDLTYVHLPLTRHRDREMMAETDSNVGRGSQSISLQENLTLLRMDSSHMSPVFQAIGSFMRGDTQATLCCITEFLEDRIGCNCQDSNVEMEYVYFPQCTFSGQNLSHLLDPAVCSNIEKTIFLRLLSGLSYRQTQDHDQTQWLINLITSPEERAFCEAQLYGEFNNHQQQVLCQKLLENLDQQRLSHQNLEYHRHQALLHDTLGVLLAKDPQEIDILTRLQWKMKQHDRARRIRQNLVSQAGCDCLDRVLVQLDSYTSLQSAGYARAALSCTGVSLSSDDRIALAKTAEIIHSESMAEQQLLLNVLGIDPDKSGHTPGMLAARFDKMLRGLRIQQLSRLLFSPSVTRQEDMLHHVHTQMIVIAHDFAQIPQHCLDDNIVALKEGMLSRIGFLNAQIISGTIQAFALDNPYIPE